MNTLTQLFDWLLAASLRASLLTLAVILVQAVLRRHLSARMRHALWLPVLVVLLMPVLPESRWSIEHVFQTPPQPAQPVTPSAIAPVVESTAVAFDASVPLPTPVDWQRIILLAWVVGCSGILVLGSLSFMLTLRRFKQVRHPASDELLDTLDEIAHEMHLRQIPRVLIASSISSPAVTGLLRPTLLLPLQFDQEFTPAEARLVLKHELMHLKRGDLPLNALMCVLMALHWFNPLLWIAFFKIRADREAACDAQVLRDATKDHRAEYGHALLKVETAFCPRGLSLGFVGIFQRGSALRSRIQSIAIHHNPHPTMKAIITLCIVLMTFFGITRAQRPEPVRDFTLGQASFRDGDSIRINSVQTTAETITVAVDYELASEDEASIALFITVKDSGRTPVDPRQRAMIKKGKGSVVLVHPNPQPGMPHVTFYSKAGKSIGGIYFGTKEEAAASKAMKLNYMTTSEPSGSGDAASYLQNKLAKIIIPHIQFRGATVDEALDYLRIKSREFDTLTTDPKLRGVNIILRPGDAPASASITLDLKEVPLGEALRYVVELASLKMSVQPFAVLVAGSFPPAASPAPQLSVQPPSGKIVIPSIEFHDATLSEALDFIRIQSRKLDPEKRGVNIIVKPGGDNSGHIALSLKDVPVSEALRYCAELANHKLTADAQSFFITPASKDQASAPAAPPLNAAEQQAAELRRARPQQYDFAKAVLGDVLRFLATDAHMQFISLPEDSPASQKLVTFSVRGSPFEVMETLCRANGLVLGLNQDRWFVRPADDAEQVVKDYVLPRTNATVETILEDINSVLDGQETKLPANASKPSVTFKKDKNFFHVTATRLQHSWVSAYFQGLNSSAQSANAR